MKYIVNKEQDKLTLKELLKSELRLTTHLIKHLKHEENRILVNGKHANVDLILKENDIIELDFSDSYNDVNEHLVKTDISIDIIYEDENMTVVNKSANMPTHQSLKHYDDTLSNALAFRYKDKPYVFRAINRLDKDTSGVVVTANNRFFADILAKKLQNGAFTKEYIAVVKGKIDKKGTINAPIARKQESIIERVIRDDGELAITEYEPILSCDEISVLKVKPITGRTHQIRVHMSYIGHPIIGDALYFEKSDLISRQALHAYRLGIDGIGEYIAKIPNDIMSLIRRYFKNDEILA